jgi:hypothetical protein
MEHLVNELWRTPSRHRRTFARGMVVLSMVVLVLAALGFVTYEGLQRVAYVTAMGSIGLGNLAWAMGSLLPEIGGGRRAREAARPFFLLMLVALPIALATDLAR